MRTANWARRSILFIRCGQTAKQESVGTIVAVAAAAESGAVGAIYDLAADQPAIVASHEKIADIADLNRVGLLNPRHALAFNATIGAKQGHGCGRFADDRIERASVNLVRDGIERGDTEAARHRARRDKQRQPQGKPAQPGAAPPSYSGSEVVFRMGLQASFP